MGLKVWLPLITDEHNQGASDAIPVQAGVTFTTAGKIGTCGYFSGTNTSYINTNYSTAVGTNDFSIALWLKLPAITSGSYFAICTSKTAAAASAGFGIYWNYSQKKFLWSTADGSAGTEIWMATAVDSIVYDKWIHLVMVRDNNDSKKGFFYINGTRYELASVPAIRNITTDTKMHIGKCTNGSYPTKMYINDFRIYNHALSAAEVKEISQGLVLHYKFDQTIGYTDIAQNPTTYVVYNNYSGSGTTGTLTNLSETFNGSIVRREVMTPNDTSVNNFKSSLGSHGIYGFRQTFLANTKYVFWIYYRPISHLDIRAGGTASNIGGWTEIPPVAVGNGWYRVGQYRNGTVTTDKTDNIFTSFYTPTAASGVPITIDWASPHLLQGTTEIPSDDSFMGNNLIIDSSGYGYHGVANGSLISSLNTRRYSQSLYIPVGLTDYVQTQNKVGYFTNAITMSIWLKSSNTSPGSSYHHCFNTATNWVYVEMAVHANGYLRCGLYINGTRYVANTSNTNLLDGNWHMLTMTYDGSQLKRYVDGVLRTEATQNATGNLNTSSDYFVFGRGASTGYHCKEAYLSDARLYCTALSADAIRQLYEVGAKVDNKQSLHTFELVENNSKIQITKQGQVKCNELEENEKTKFYQADQIVEANEIIEL